MNASERTLAAADGTPLVVTTFAPAGAPRFAVLVSHGQSEHVGRYRWLGEAVAAAGGVAFGPDHRGEGASGGRRGHVQRFEEYAADLALVARAQGLPPGCPLVLFSHSMGGLIGLHFLLDHGEDLGVKGAVVSAPLIELCMEVGVLKRVAARVANVLLPTLPIANELPATEVLRCPELVKEYEADPRRSHTVTPRWVAAMEAGQRRVFAEATRLTLPMLWYGGDDDRVCSTAAARRCFGSLADPAANDQTFEVLPGVFHEPHNEPAGTREAIREKAVRWLADRAGA